MYIGGVTTFQAGLMPPVATFISAAVQVAIPARLMTPRLMAVSSDSVGMENFFSSQGLTYMPRLRFKNSDVKRQSQVAAANFESAARRIASYGSHMWNVEKLVFVETMRDATGEMEYGVSPKLGIAMIGAGIGFGCFAMKKMKRGEFIGEYTGNIVDIAMLSGVNAYAMVTNPWDELVAATVRGKHPLLVTDSERGGSEIRFMNHISDNVRLNGSGRLAANAYMTYAFSAGLFHVLVHAARAIKAGEELRLDYGPRYWRDGEQADESHVYRLHDGAMYAVATQS